MEEVLKADPKCIKAVEEYETDIRTVYGVLDRALHSLNSLMKINLQLQEIIVGILQGNVPDQSALLIQIHQLSKTSKIEESLFLKQVADFADSSSQLLNHDVLLRFYIRVVERINRKLALFSNHRRNLHFLTYNVVRLWHIKEILTAGEGLKDLRIYVDIMNIIVRQNQQLHKLLLELIVSENFVSSVDEFNSIPMATHQRRKKSSRHSYLLHSRPRKSGISIDQQPSEIEPVHSLPQPAPTMHKLMDRKKLSVQDLFNKFKEGYSTNQEFYSTVCYQVLRNNVDMATFFKDSKYKHNGKSGHLGASLQPARRKSLSKDSQQVTRGEAIGEHHKILGHGYSRSTVPHKSKLDTVGGYHSQRGSTLKRSARQRRAPIRQYSKSPSKRIKKSLLQTIPFKQRSTRYKVEARLTRSIFSRDKLVPTDILLGGDLGLKELQEEKDEDEQSIGSSKRESVYARRNMILEDGRGSNGNGGDSSLENLIITKKYNFTEEEGRQNRIMNDKAQELYVRYQKFAKELLPIIDAEINLTPLESQTILKPIDGNQIFQKQHQTVLTMRPAKLGVIPTVLKVGAPFSSFKSTARSTSKPVASHSSRAAIRTPPNKPSQASYIVDTHSRTYNKFPKLPYKKAKIQIYCTRLFKIIS